VTGFLVLMKTQFVFCKVRADLIYYDLDKLYASWCQRNPFLIIFELMTFSLSHETHRITLRFKTVTFSVVVRY
jgi:hypothetical protein